MDDIVKAALKKWPNVPDCRGWLALDARGDWYMRDDRVQAAGPFPFVKGSRILHDKLRAFIGRNYEADASGGWFFQNGPQKVFVELEAAPWVFGVQRLDGEFRVETQTGRPVPSVGEALVDELGRLFLHTPIGLGLVRSADMDSAADAVVGGVWMPQDVLFADLPVRFGYDLSPQRRRSA
ncbi:DUF2946 family protein [Sphaerotilus sp.]|uniref:DUF2946 family protein n=1 Tax=Sphaerotilus sp. TaxID=2093942 RepID=UPI0034E29071